MIAHHLWFGTCIDETDDFWIQMPAERIEEPSMRVDLLRILGLDAKNELHRHETFRLVLGWKDQLWLLRYADLRCIFEDVADSRNAIDLFKLSARSCRKRTRQRTSFFMTESW